jgi:hypothetical protein
VLIAWLAPGASHARDRKSFQIRAWMRPQEAMRFAARAFDTRSRHDAVWWCKAQVEFNGALGYKALRRS